MAFVVVEVSRTSVLKVQDVLCHLDGQACSRPFVPLCGRDQKVQDVLPIDVPQVEQGRDLGALQGLVKLRQDAGSTERPEWFIVLVQLRKRGQQNLL